MDRLDHQAEPLIEQAVHFNAISLDRVSKHRTVATWATLIACIVDQTQASPIIPRESCEWFRKNRAPFQRTSVWLAATRDAQEEVNAWPIKWLMPGDTDGYLCTVRIKHLVMQTFVPTERTPRDLVFDRRGNLHVVSLWPTPASEVRWPPQRVLERSELESFARSFVNS